MSFLESVLLKNRFYFICILDFPVSVIRFLSPPFHFALFLGNTLSFVGLAKPMGQGGRDFTFQSSLSSLAVSDFFPCGFFYLFYSLKSSYVPVLAGQGLAESIPSCTP